MAGLKSRKILHLWGLTVLFCLILGALSSEPRLTSRDRWLSERRIKRTTYKPQFVSNKDGQLRIPGLYEGDGTVVPIQGEKQFHRAIFGLQGSLVDSNCSDYNIKQAGQTQTISLVQFYMATCPDCQGFSPYFKRFARDITRHWWRLVTLYTVNCNDFENIHLCQAENPKIIVPTMRWYTLPIIQRDARQKHCGFGYKSDLLTINHRQFIDEQRRDHIALRRATLRFIGLTLDELAREDSGDSSANRASSLGARRKLLDSLPTHWHQLNQLGRSDDSVQKFLDTIEKREEDCHEKLGTPRRAIHNYVILERARSSIGRTVIADWSEYACNVDQTPHLLIHRSGNFDILRDFKLDVPESHKSKGIFLLRLSGRRGTPILQILGSNHSESWERSGRHARTSDNRLERIQQRVSLERFYSHLGASDDKQPVRYASAMGASNSGRKYLIRRRETSPPLLQSDKATYENANWTPESAYPDEERLRFYFNQLIGFQLNLAERVIPGQLFKGEHPGFINRSDTPTNITKVDPVDDDLTPMYLTDYYKGLDEIVHIDMMNKADVDGFQLLASSNFLRDIKHFFPFQSNALLPEHIGSKSIARYYIQLVQEGWIHELSHNLKSHSNLSKLFEHNIVWDKKSVLTAKQLEKVLVSSRKLENIQINIKQKHDVGLPSTKHFRWYYCGGSSGYLRGHTCSLWVLFHTLTVEEYVHNGKKYPQGNSSDPVEYQFQIDYSRPPKQACNPENPDNTFISSSNQDLFVNSTDFVLANIINFVRFYLPCTNCAAHFSCMVLHSPGLHFHTDEELRRKNLDSHLLWLWEGHNRVNMRTRGTHSEDPMRPKHIFPQFGACPKCYIEQPKTNYTFESMRFNRTELVKFIVNRYKKSAILNNRVNVEALYNKTVA